MEINQNSYPQVQIENPDPVYAREMLGNIGGPDSEMSAAGQYFYSYLMTGDQPEIAKLFHRLAMEEALHLELFAKAAQQLGADPRLWRATERRHRYWSPKSIHYSKKIRKIVTNALIDEHMTVDKYTKQIKTIKDPNLVELLRRVLEDEKEHIKILTDLLKQV